LFCVQSWTNHSTLRFQPTSSLFQIGKLPLPSHYATLAELSGRPVTQQPQRSFVYMLTQQPIVKDEELVIAAPITCQRGAGILKFSYWLIGDRSAIVKVCTQDSQARSCTKSIVYTETSLVAVEVVHPQAAVFDVEIAISNISPSQHYSFLTTSSTRLTYARDQKIEAEHAEVIDEFFEEGADSPREENRSTDALRTESKRGISS
ncbi:hypothetical protein COOONC_20164, partial [Cooperia oncophora]